MTTKPQEEPARKNRLSKATSPYLLQHAENPVDWYEWGNEAFQKARNEDKPIFLSVGYAACHWCHVMEHESFESQEVARVLNDNFVSIKVDREERPDIDEIYMAYTQARTGRGGWPMSVWLTPEGAPFFSGTYFPKDQFIQVLTTIQQAWLEQREAILDETSTTKAFLNEWASGPTAAEGVPGQSIVDQTAGRLARAFDRTRGGLSSGQNKFPPSMAMDLLLRSYRRTGDLDLLSAVDITLDHMARGGIYDHLGGGICRYSTDPEWLVPHFEKMLYDQGMVSSIYLDAYQVTKKPEYAYVAADIFDYVMTDLQSPEGGFYSSRDADSGGLEGAFYIWTIEEVHRILGPEDGKLCCAFYDVTESGNWFERMGHAPKGPKNILHIPKPPDVFAKMHNISVEDLNQRRKAWRQKLLEARGKRIAPGLDDKILTAWNGLMIAALAKGARVLDEPKYAQAATKAAECILTHLQKDGRLLRTYRKGEARLGAYLEDYAFFIEGLLNLYEATFDQKWLREAQRLADVVDQYYFDAQAGGYFFTASGGESLLARSKSPHDSAIPSGNSVHALNLLRLSVYFDRKDFRERAETIFKAFAPQTQQSPYAFERHMCALDFYHDRVKEIAIIGEEDSPDTKALIRVVCGQYLPNKVIAHSATKITDTSMPLLTNKTLMNGKPAAYVCEHYTCQQPVTDPEQLLKQLERQTKRP